MNFHVKYKIGSSMHNLGNIGVVFSLSVKRSGIYMAVLLRPRRMKNCCLLLRRPADRPKGGSQLLLSSPLPERHTSPLAAKVKISVFPFTEPFYLISMETGGDLQLRS